VIQREGGIEWREGGRGRGMYGVSVRERHGRMRQGGGRKEGGEAYIECQIERETW